jgi:oxygen-independent coproporphyrinogen III oxidase
LFTGPCLILVLFIKPSLYIHIPFCKSRCTYCDFYSCALGGMKCESGELFKRYTDQLILQQEILRSQFSIKDYQTIYFGGGTPSLLPREELARFIKSLKLSGNIKEMTIEVNPESLTEELLLSYNRLGINRISMGLQSLRPEILKRMGRLASREKALESISLLKKWEGTWSVDYIFAFPGQDRISQLKDLEELLSLNPPHFSLYTLSVEEGTPLDGNLKKGNWHLPEEEEMEEAWEQALSLIEAAGYERYEISSFCRKGHYSRHNLAYWETTPWLGLGAAAASMMKDDSRFTGGSLEEFLSATEKDLGRGGSFYLTVKRSLQDRVSEDFMMGLRTKWGIGTEKLEKLLGENIEKSFLHNSLQKWNDKLIWDAGGIRLNSQGLDWHSGVMVDILLDLDKYFDYNTSL